MKKDIDKDDFLEKWLSGNLTDVERKKFESSNDYLAYKDILKGVEYLERPFFDVEKGFAEQKIFNASYKKTKTVKLSTWLYGAAAIVLVIIGFKMFGFQNTIISTKIAEKNVVTLPDSSLVTLNADSSLEYNKKSFFKDRELHLKGEAFFDVKKGVSFTVHTKNGKVTVLGTEFNVYARAHQLEVHCFEGKVRVSNNENTVILTQGKGVKSLRKEALSSFHFSNLQPDWLQGKSSFEKVPLSELINELERQYAITIDAVNIDVDRKFTGFFTHNNLEAALRTSFAPMYIEYTFTNKNNIALKNK